MSVVTIDGAGSTWTNRFSLYVGSNGSGTLNIANGGLVTVGTDVWIDRYSHSEGTLRFGIRPDGTGLLDAGRNLTIGNISTLLMSFDGGEIPTVGDEFTVITFGGTRNGRFTNEPTPTLAGDYLLDWAVHYNANDITLEVISRVAVVPEPSALVLLSLFLCLGAIGRFGYCRRSK